MFLYFILLLNYFIKIAPLFYIFKYLDFTKHKEKSNHLYDQYNDLHIVIPTSNHLLDDCCPSHHNCIDEKMSFIKNPKMRNIISYLKNKLKRDYIEKHECLCIQDDNNINNIHPKTLYQEMINNGADFIHQIPLIKIDESDSILSNNTIDSYYMNIVHARIYIISHMLGINCTTGKSTLMKGNNHVDFLEISNYISEDNIISSFYKNRVLSQYPVYHKLDVKSGLQQYFLRRSRWSVNRKFGEPWSFYLELLSELYMVNIMIYYKYSLFEMMINTVVWIVLDQIIYKKTTGKNINIVCWLIRELSSPFIFIYSWFQNSVVWKDKEYKLGYGGRIHTLID